VFDIDIEHCPNCGGCLKIIAAIFDSAVITKILSICTCRRAHRPDQRRGESICSKRPDRTLKLPSIRLGHRPEERARSGTRASGKTAPIWDAFAGEWPGTSRDSSRFDLAPASLTPRRPKATLPTGQNGGLFLLAAGLFS
jgi:hypothetical protein